MAASKSQINRLKISMWCPTIEDKSLDLPSFFMVAGGEDLCPRSYLQSTKSSFLKEDMWQDSLLLGLCSADFCNFFKDYRSSIDFFITFVTELEWWCPLAFG